LSRANTNILVSLSPDVNDRSLGSLVLIRRNALIFVVHMPSRRTNIVSYMIQPLIAKEPNTQCLRRSYCYRWRFLLVPPPQGIDNSFNYRRI